MNADSEHRRTETLPTGLVLFRTGTEPAERKRRQIFVAVYLVVTALLVWPIFPLFSSIQPLVLGLPLSFAWVVLALGVMFVASIWLYFTDDHG